MDLPILTKEEYLNLSTPTIKNECKGRYYRCYNTKFESKGTIYHTIKFVPLIRQSCSGCEQCNLLVDSLIDTLPEIDYNYICHSPKDGAMYKLSITNIKVGFEGDADDWDLEFVLVEKE
jgi:hypothetical protein